VLVSPLGLMQVVVDAVKEEPPRWGIRLELTDAPGSGKKVQFGLDKGIGKGKRNPRDEEKARFKGWGTCTLGFHRKKNTGKREDRRKRNGARKKTENGIISWPRCAWAVDTSVTRRLLRNGLGIGEERILHDPGVRLKQKPPRWGSPWKDVFFHRWRATIPLSS